MGNALACYSLVKIVRKKVLDVDFIEKFYFRQKVEVFVYIQV